MSLPTREFVDNHLDRSYLIETLVRLLRVPTQVPLGPQTLMEPDDPKLVHYVQNVIRPELKAIGLDIIDAPLNQLLVKLGLGNSNRALLVMVYTPTQHANQMRDPFSGKIAIPVEYGYDEPCAFGQGASQNKAHMAAMLAVLKMLLQAHVELEGTLYFAVNNEGRSSHACSNAILSCLDRKPTAGLILIGIDREMSISLGNRGRVDIYIHVQGKSTHSSDPASGLNAIEGANKVINRIRKLRFPASHPLLGGQHAVIYQVTFDPVAPHTLPGYAKLTLDRRLLPGEKIDDAVEQIRAVIGDLSPFEVTVEPGVYMLPALVDANAEIVNQLESAITTVKGKASAQIYLKGSFDAGGPCAAGIPTVMWGVSGETSLLGDDFVPLSAVVDEARVLGYLIMDMLDGTFAKGE